MSNHSEVIAADLEQEDYMTVDAQALIELATALVPKLAERAKQTELDGKVSEESVKEIAAAGLFRVLQPKRWGGAELDPRVFYRIQMILAQGCMSTAWIYGVISVHNWQLPLFPEQAQQDVWQKDDSTLIASTYMPVGKAVPVEGGYMFSGRWGFSSGCEHCEWIFLGALLPKEDGSEGLEHTTFLLPKSDFTIDKNWDVHGLRGTGSHDIVVDNVFVPAHRTQRTNNHSDAGCPGRELNNGWLYKIPFTQVFQRAVSTACIGALDGAINEFKQRASMHVGKHGSKTAEDPNAQFAVTAAMMTSDQLKLVMLRNYQRIVDCVKSNQVMDVEERLLQRAQAASVPKLCGEHVDDLLKACAASGLYRSNPIERIFRDIHQARGHIANNGDAYMRAHGSVMLGLPNLDPFI
ncbi:Acyl-CoA dehydrogenase type 2 domain [Shewanella halifaxensis HAW-EB4]|uniref:Acyl-CoA dehydrogenase type 2 domain n=1 Tax=Shewanella halifaxensis (strain HAW-EB4) TaxID=458817 RepID=B0TTU2_SHEHH|nr:acyl-CoA dehydrogenase family protein [Shewanella halifaxensis]ABZ76660.1 Acyl-CoA dehydrogenase type 2 domain [Shewanella halifaxensis HAW-EB4]